MTTKITYKNNDIIIVDKVSLDQLVEVYRNSTRPTFVVTSHEIEFIKRFRPTLAYYLGFRKKGEDYDKIAYKKSQVLQALTDSNHLLSTIVDATMNYYTTSRLFREKINIAKRIGFLLDDHELQAIVDIMSLTNIVDSNAVTFNLSIIGSLVFKAWGRYEKLYKFIPSRWDDMKIMESSEEYGWFNAIMHDLLRNNYEESIVFDTSKLGVPPHECEFIAFVQDYQSAFVGLKGKGSKFRYEGEKIRVTLVPIELRGLYLRLNPNLMRFHHEAFAVGGEISLPPYDFEETLNRLTFNSAGRFSTVLGLLANSFNEDTLRPNEELSIAINQLTFTPLYLFELFAMGTTNRFIPKQEVKEFYDRMISSIEEGQPFLRELLVEWSRELGSSEQIKDRLMAIAYVYHHMLRPHFPQEILEHLNPI